MIDTETNQVAGLDDAATANADLANLAGLAASLDAQNAPVMLDPVTGQAPPPEVPMAEQARDMVNMFAGLVCGFAPAAADIWTEPKKEMAAAVLVPVMQKYNWNMTAIPCELAAAVVVGPLLYQSAKCVAAEMQAQRNAQALKKAAKQGQADQAGPDQARKDETPMAGVHSQMGLYPQ